jgi:hypothetical protein
MNGGGQIIGICVTLFTTRGKEEGEKGETYK